MKVVILAGGYGTRLSEMTKDIPKPLVKIAEKPILMHIMDHFSKYNHNEFIIATGYKSEEIKRYFLNFNQLNSDYKINLKSGNIEILNANTYDWNVSPIYTGLNTMTGGRLKRLNKFINDETFLLTYGDAVSNVDINSLIEFHKSHGKMVTLTAVNKRSQFGQLDLEGNLIKTFKEKPGLDNNWINGGYFVINSKFLDYIKDDETVLEREPLERVADMGELMAFKHHGFWQCMDSLKDLEQLKDLWSKNLSFENDE